MHLQFLYCYCINVTCPIPEIYILLVQSFFEVTPYFYLILYYIAFSKSANISICFVQSYQISLSLKKFSSRSYYIKYLSYITHEYNHYTCHTKFTMKVCLHHTTMYGFQEMIKKNMKRKVFHQSCSLLLLKLVLSNNYNQLG